MKKGWNKNGDSNLSTECPIAALYTDGSILYSEILNFNRVKTEAADLIYPPF